MEALIGTPKKDPFQWSGAEESPHYHKEERVGTQRVYIMGGGRPSLTVDWTNSTAILTLKASAQKSEVLLQLNLFLKFFV